MTDEELQAIRERWTGDLNGSFDDVRALLAEVDRLRAFANEWASAEMAGGHTLPTEPLVPPWEAPWEPGDAPTPGPSQDAFDGSDGHGEVSGVSVDFMGTVAQAKPWSELTHQEKA